MPPSLKCPFFGTPITLWKTGIGWFATSDYRDSGWATPLFATEADLLRALAPRVPAGVPLPAASTVTSCPFSGKEIVIRPAGDGLYEAVVDGLWVSRPMVDRRRVEYMISTRGGIPPIFDSSVSVKVRERAPPPEPTIIPAPEGEGNVRESVERLVAAMDSKHSVVVDGLRKSSRLRTKRSVE